MNTPTGKFTEGPWRAFEDKDGFWWVEANGPLVIAKVSSIILGVQDNANASLIAAAPSLYEALKAINALANQGGEQAGFSLKAQYIAQRALEQAEGIKGV